MPVLSFSLPSPLITGSQCTVTSPRPRVALQALVKTWAAELAPTIRVNCIAPALTDTPLAGNLLATAAKRQAMAEKYPLGRFGTPRDIAAAANFLLSSESDWMTGQVLRVDGGMSSVVRL